MASIRKKISPNGLVIWQSRWREPGLDGKDRQRTKNFPNAREAKAHAAKVEQEIERRGAVNTRPRRSLVTSATSALPRARSEPSRLKSCRRPISTAPI